MENASPRSGPAPGVGPAIRRLVGDSMVYGVGRVAGYLVGLVLLPVYTRHLGLAEYGLLENLFVLAMLFGTVVPMGLPDALQRFRFLAADEAERRRTTGTAFAGVLLALAAAVPVLVLAAGPICRGLFDAPEAATPFRLAAVTLVPACLLSLAFSLLRAGFRRGAFGISSVFQVLAVGGLNTYFVAVAGLGLTGVFLGGAIASTLTAVLALWFVRSELSLRLDPAVLRRLLAYGAPLVPAFAAMWALNYADRWILLRLAGAGEVGLYSAGARIAGVMLFLTFAFSTAFPPLAMDLERRPEATRVFARSITLYAAAAGALAVVLAAVARPALALLAPPEYAEGARAVPWLAAGFLFAGAAPALRIGLYLRRATRHVLWIDGSAAAANVLLNLLLVPRFGMEGAAAATTASFALLALLSILAARPPLERRRLLLILLATALSLSVLRAV